MEIYYK